MATLNPPLGGKGTITVADDDVDRFTAQGWTRTDGEGGTLPEPEETTVATDTGGPEASDDREAVGSLVSGSLGDEDVLVTDFGRPGDAKAAKAAEGDADTGVAEVSGDEPVRPKATTRKSTK